MNLRDAMPETAAFIAAVRETFGVDAVNPSIRKGMAGLPGHFHAVENGNEAGTPFKAENNSVCLSEIDITPTQKDKDADRNRRR